MSYRLTNKAFNLLKQEVERSTKGIIAGEVQKEIILKRLDKLTTQKGTRITESEIATEILDILPNFPKTVIQKAALANRKSPLQKWGSVVGIVGLSVVSLTGVVWFVNLPFPFIRRPVAKVAPILLLPSFLSIDSNYREAISNVEQADQLVNSATSPADIELGKIKTSNAQKNLDNLPVWFLGYEPVFMCQFMMGCSWHFTLDEFQTARTRVARMQAKVFQEDNMLTQLKKAQLQIDSSKKNYQTLTNPNQRQIALNDWQKGIDQLTQIPAGTLAGKIAQTQLNANQRDFSKLSGQIVGNQQTGNFIESAKQFRQQVTKLAGKPPHPLIQWQQAEELLQNAINLLQNVQNNAPDFLKAQELLAQYKADLAWIRINANNEEESSRALNQAKVKMKDFLADSQQISKNRLAGELQEIIDQLEMVKRGTTNYNEAQSLLESARKKLKLIM